MCIAPVTLVREYRKMGTRWEDAAQVVPCGKCVECLKRRSNAWTFRLLEQMKVSTSAAFLTLTYENCPISDNNLHTLDKRDYQLFMKKLRKKTGKKLKYYACGEYGSSGARPHYHSIMYNLPQHYLQDNLPLAEAWGKGHVHIGNVSIASIKYVAKYVMKGTWTPDDYVDDQTGELYEDDRLPEFALMSKNLGMNHLSEAMKLYYKSNQVNYATLPGGVKTSLPRYFREKVYTYAERKLMALYGIEMREKQYEKLFRDAYHELIWKKDLIRREAKLITLRQKS